MPDPEEIGEWIAKAEEDYAGAVQLNRRRSKPLPNLVCFHAQQCAEKYLKAFLISRGASFPKIHDLVALLDQCVENDQTLEKLRDSCLLLDPYSVLFRYPGQNAFPEDAKAAMQAVRQVRTLLRRRVSNS